MLQKLVLREPVLRLVESGWFWVAVYVGLALIATTTTIGITNVAPEGIVTSRAYTAPYIPASVNFLLKREYRDFLYDRPGILRGGAGGIGLPYAEEYSLGALWQGDSREGRGVVDQDNNGDVALDLFALRDNEVWHFKTSLGLPPSGTLWSEYRVVKEPDSHPTLSGGKINAPFRYEWRPLIVNLVYFLAVMVGLVLAGVTLEWFEKKIWRRNM